MGTIGQLLSGAHEPAAAGDGPPVEVVVNDQETGPVIELPDRSVAPLRVAK